MYEPQKTEEEILKFWKDKKIYEKSKKKNLKGKKFYMMDGPPYATGSIHMGTALNKILKDIAMRSKRLQGFDVFDRAGYDTHGVPIEYQIEKEIGSKSKKDIEKFGVKNFINKCKEFATKFIGLMNSDFENLGVWMDFKNPYLTLSNEYVETIWDAFKIADKKNLLYLGKYPIHVCPRCETAVAYNEIEYHKQEDVSIYVKFPVKNEKNKFLIVWTTTPWTLPGNTGVIVHPDFIYQEIKISNNESKNKFLHSFVYKPNETWIIAKELVPKIIDKLDLEYSVKKEYKGKELENLEYENPLAKDLKIKLKNPSRIVLSKRYVNLEEGTGLVHCAPGHGKEDYEVGKEHGLDMVCPVEIDGLLTKDAGKYSGKKARVVDSEIIEDLEKSGFLVHKLKYSHDYPLCWRCKNALLMVSLQQWFFKISTIHSKILKENKKINWIPKYMELRMKAWLEGISDWPISRKRYWGTPLPIWICEKCGNKKVVGSAKELEKLSGKKVIELHKPEIDKIYLPCKCGGKMKRVEEVLDVWFDSGVSSWAALEYSKNKKKFEKFWPADLNIEGKDQIRGWWNSQIILSEIKFDKKPFENIFVHGMVVDLGKKKMSKSLGNIVFPKDIIKKYSRDYMRYYFAKTSKGEDFAFDEKEFKDIQKVFRVLINTDNFINQIEKKKSLLKIEDKWILSIFNSMIKKVTEKYNNYKFFEAVQIIEEFLINDLSRNYIKIIRERNNEVYAVLNEIRTGLFKILAPIVPFITEKVWQNLKEKKIVKEESVHLSSWPKADEKKIDKKLEEDMQEALRIIEVGLAERDKTKIGLKWPLPRATIHYYKKLDKELEKIIELQLNVKKLEFKFTSSKGTELSVELDTELTPELEAEGYAREMSRHVQAFRKKLGLVKKDKIKLFIIADEELKNILEKQKDFIQNRTNSSTLKIVTTDKERFKKIVEFKIKDKRGWIVIV
ncbi:isoleucine--tRNA ligase [Candidatus Pacearchaeota archaeon]|nr:isoleucine--tRNA ligase [Candidatus Pacearchaeota archaeon]